MPPTDDIMGPCDHLPPLDELDFPNSNFFAHAELASSSHHSCDLSRYDCKINPLRPSDAFSQSKSMRLHYYENYPGFYVPAYASSSHASTSKHKASSTTMPPWVFQNKGPLNLSGQTQSGGILDSPTVSKHVAWKQTPPSPPPSQPIMASDSRLGDPDAHYMYQDSSEDLLSPLNFRSSSEWDNNDFAGTSFPTGYHSMARTHKFSSPDELYSSLEHISSPNQSPDARRYTNYLDTEDWMNSPKSEATDTDDDSSLASSISSLSPPLYDDLNSRRGELPIDDEDDDHHYCTHSTGPIYQHLEEYPLHASPRISPLDFYNPTDDDGLQSLTFTSPTSPLCILPSAQELPSQLTSTSQHNHVARARLPPPPPLPLARSDFDPSYFYEFDPSIPIPGSPSRRRSSSLPDLDPQELALDPFGLTFTGAAGPSTLTSSPEEIQSYLAGSPSRLTDDNLPSPRMQWLSLPGSDTDDDLIPTELASKNYIPDPSILAPSTSSRSSSLLLWDHDLDAKRRALLDANDDVEPPRSPSPENFYLDPTVLAECAEKDEEVKKVYDLRQRTARTDKWARERCRELSALLRLKLDERGVSVTGNSGSSNETIAEPLSPETTIHQPQPMIGSLPTSDYDPSSTVSNPSSTPTPTPQSPRKQSSSSSKPKFTSMAQLVANMVFHRQDALRRYFAQRSRQPPASKEGAKAHPTPRSPLSQVVLPQELEDEGDDDYDNDNGKGRADESDGRAVALPNDSEGERLEWASTNCSGQQVGW
ncbi:hypothetical protein B0H34DRAFT_286897 [Crassisporium funariophilum]|nr:hypothetical protein B0H34DRAFT_286897 [Crassisporium funariophilum]